MTKNGADKQPKAYDATDVNSQVDSDYHAGGWVDYEHLITTRPHKIRRVFVSDLHLSCDEPALVQAFLGLLDDCIALPHLMALYILGDWFDMWIGDDAYLTLTDLEKQQHWLTPIISQLQQLHTNGCQILVMHGNRDFLISQRLCDVFGGKLIAEPYRMNLGHHHFRLEHGDALCTDDVAYQRLRKVLRHPLVRWGLLRRPLAKRQQLAAKIRQKSSIGKASKPEAIMDVNPKAVHHAMAGIDALLHGHTHRPAIQSLTHHKTRYVLGDWRLQQSQARQPHVEAVIAMTIDELAKDEMDNNDTTTAIKGSECFIMAKYRYASNS